MSINLTVALVLALAALIVSIASGVNKAPLWVAVVLLAVLALVTSLTR